MAATRATNSPVDRRRRRRSDGRSGKPKAPLSFFLSSSTLPSSSSGTLSCAHWLTRPALDLVWGWGEAEFMTKPFSVEDPHQIYFSTALFKFLSWPSDYEDPLVPMDVDLVWSDWVCRKVGGDPAAKRGGAPETVIRWAQIYGAALIDDSISTCESAS